MHGYGPMTKKRRRSKRNKSGGQVFNFWDWDKKNTLEGWFICYYPDVVRFKKPVFSFQVAKKIFHSWGYADLRHKLWGVVFKTKVRLKYLGIDENDELGFKKKYWDMDILELPVTPQQKNK